MGYKDVQTVKVAQSILCVVVGESAYMLQPWGK